MSAVEIMTLERTATSLDAAAVDSLRGSLRGQLVLKGDPGYDEARAIWNAMIDHRPALIVRCRGTSDVMRAVKFAADRSLLLSVRGGGHNIAGSAICEGGMVVDLSLMRSVRVDAKARRAWVEGGATLADFDHEAQAFGLATPLGINSTTGVAGLTLGGGFGWFSRKAGMTCDNLLSVDIVTADGGLLRASAGENPDLFWALCGGSGNFGVVTGFEFQLHPLGPQVYSGLVVYPIDQAKKVLTAYREWLPSLPDEATVWVVARKAPPLPFLPPAVHGREIVAFAVFYAGDPAKGEKILSKAQSLGTPVGAHLGAQPYTSWQQAFDPLLTPGARNYWKSHNFASLADGAIDALIDSVHRLPSPHCEIFFGCIGGQTMRVKPDATAYPHRDTLFAVNVHGRWETAEEDGKGIAWARDFFEKTKPFATGGVYVNFMTADETARVHSAYGTNYERLATIKRKYDPRNLFRTNQNIAPA
ncbi:MAG: FAD-binding oxidoreductase [Acidobacteriia bacterium]|nr:FAD-binding oxidoreductase [Terriglobia bacterium]